MIQKNLYNENYYTNYYQGDFEKKPREYAQQLATQIVQIYNPKSVLELGCSFGFLVSELRELGVEAYGIDFSEYAISNVPDKIKNYVSLQSIEEDLPENFPKKFDMVLSIQLLEHLYEEDGLLAIKKICTYSDVILFSSNPNATQKKIHVNVQEPAYWSKHFANESFFNDPNKAPSFIKPYAMYLYKTKDMNRVAEDFERSNSSNRMSIEDILNTKNAEISQLMLELNKHESKAIELDEKLKAVTYQRDAIRNSFFWKVTKPLRTFLEFIRSYSTVRKSKSLLNPYNITNKQDLLMQTNTKFDKDIKFSILVPLYNTPKKFLEEMIESVQNQTYKNWELCLADGSTDDFDFVGTICKKYAKKDSRIVYKKLEKNLGISENTNECIKMATGNYIALFDHDDLLHPSVLYYYMKEICEKNADFIYCDELVFEGDLRKLNCIKTLHHKPIFAIDNLRANNYICHLSSFKKSLLDEVGMFRKEFDGSQDHDMILRLTEKANNICHVPKVLYFWRSHKNSVAQNIGAKPYAVIAGQNSVASHLDRCGIKYKSVTSTECLSIYHIDYELNEHPLVSIVISDTSSLANLKLCINSITQLSSYDNYEIIVVNNGNNDIDTLKYYEELKFNSKIKILHQSEDNTFNYSKTVNSVINCCSGEQIILFNSNLEVITENWIEEMLMYSQRPDVGVVGSTIYNNSGKIEHAGAIIGVSGISGISHKDFKFTDLGYMGRLLYSQNLSAVKSDCMMFKKSIFKQVLGFDETDFSLSYSDIDFCLKVRELGYLVCYTPFAKLYKLKSIIENTDNDVKTATRFNAEVTAFQKKWDKILTEGDPYYNINLTKEKENFEVVLPQN